MSANPMLVEGQQVSGFQGLGGALLEEFCYSERGDPLSVTFAGYLMPTAQEIPLVEIILTEDFPARSASRAPARTAVRAAIANAGGGCPGHARSKHRPAHHAAAIERNLQSQIDR